MNLTESIESAEQEFRQILEDFFVSVYDEKNLLSHGIDHHRRVWCYAKTILSVPLRKYDLRPVCNPSELIIACFLHDIGMSVETGPRHGKHSRELCLQFLEKNRLSENDYHDLLDTIENHDKKDYASESERNDLLTVLSVADDLDAFGFTGIYRYSEIYLMRGISPYKLGHLILENAKSRFDNLEKTFDPRNSFVQKARRRYEILSNFFMHYNIQSESYDFLNAGPEGYCGLIQLFIMLIKYKMAFKDFFREAEIYSDDIIIGPFLNGLNSELSSKYQYEH